MKPIDRAGNSDQAKSVSGMVSAVVAPAQSDRCPYAQLDDLMTVIEALCPVWPSRPIMRDQSKFRL
jgi:hypothetical protein